MFVPMWIVWLAVAVLAVPVLWFLSFLFAVAISLGKDAERNAVKRRQEALEVMRCQTCQPLLPGARCDQHQWHTAPPTEWFTSPPAELAQGT
jgi:hypothetical protein